MPKRITKGNLWGFIQSRPYASVADIRRLFTMDVDDASSLPTSEGTYFVGLPQDAADMIGQLWNEGRIVLDTNPDVKALVVQGVYPARVGFGRRGGQGGQRGQGQSNPGGRPGQSFAQQRTGAGAPAGMAAERADDGTESSGKRRRRRRRRSPNSVAGAEGA